MTALQTGWLSATAIMLAVSCGVPSARASAETAGPAASKLGTPQAAAATKDAIKAFDLDMSGFKTPDIETKQLKAAKTPAPGSPGFDKTTLAQRDTRANCPDHGPGFYRIAGSDACIRLGGRVTMGAGIGSGYRGGTTPMMGAMGQVQAEVRTRTDMGTVRGYVGMRAGTAPGFGTAFGPTDRAFIHIDD